MSRKPMHLEMAGGKSPRQRMWEAMRKNRDSFDQDAIARQAKVDIGAVRSYIRCLSAGEVIETIDSVRINSLCSRSTYKLIRDVGIDAPRLTRTGVEVVQGSGNDAMWGTLRRMFKAEAVDYRQLAAFASTAATPISEATAQVYVQSLAAAGYLECVQPAAKGKAGLARYRLLPKMDSGRRAPMIQRTKRVFDPNWNRVVWTEEPELSDD